MMLDALFRHHAAATPEAIAVDAGETHVTYGALDAQVSAIAHALAARGVLPGTPVALSLPRGPDSVAALLAVFRAGGVAVPLDVSAPPERRALILEDARPALLLTRRGLVPDSAEVLAFDDIVATSAAFEPRARAEDLAYVIYTSGSTGRPKGVMVDHRSLAARIATGVHLFGTRHGDRILQFASPAFDASLLELGLALASGATLCVADPRGPPTGAALARLLRERAITVAILPPSVLAALPDTDLPQLRTLLVGGEACRAQVVDRWAGGRRFFNCYGPTEATIWAAHDECAPGEEPTLGHALPGSYIRLLRPGTRDPVAPGEHGEICVGGIGVARGYLDRPDLTAERFVPDPLGDGVIYRSGDLGRFREDGKLEFHGRIDRQVKIRGHRIELGEVEAVLGMSPDVVDVAVVADTDARDDLRLVAYVVTRTPESGPLPRVAETGLRTRLRAFLEQRLPEPFVPRAFVEVAALPLTVGAGKVDRAALPPLETLEAVRVPVHVAPERPLERTLAAIWSEVLGLPRVGIHEPFFNLGGNSLRAAEVQARLSANLGREVPLVALYEHPTIHALATYLGEHREERLAVSLGRGSARRAAATGRRAAPRRGDPALDSEEDSL